ncbi:HAMP domain-containing sensor histidine kinase [Alteromonas sp. a30]|uniref:HAMP domain-containing sensor histidine kinase n=1 Tax=Alteromonas sp. a30 TaxID=2730917 RepID=UPI00227E2B5D|nr:HAMP domain-containing sensor histidine kinase [Alteromonas sp. a30]MCY7295604.1 HAMP domain-containing protein [Alteromonas sp. a30]
MKASNLFTSLSSLSLRTLVLLGFISVTVPLTLVLLSSMVRIDTLSNQGVSAVNKVAKLVYSSKQMTELLSNMERTAGQFLILSDNALKQRYLEYRNTFLSLVDSKAAQANHDKLTQLLTQLRNEEASINARILSTGKMLSLEALQSQYGKLHEYGQQLFQLDSQIINLEISAIERSAYSVENRLMQSTIIFPLTLLISILFIRLINRPLNQLITHIKTLESGDFEQPVRVDGAKDMKDIAHTLDAMRIQLLQSEEQKKRTIQHISHELKTPLAAIREGTELLYDGTIGELNESQKHVASILRSSTERLQKLIEDLIDFNRIIAINPISASQSCELIPIIQETLEERSLEITRKRLSVVLPTHTSTLDDPITLPMHEQHCRMVFDNVLSNAIKFSPNEGQITVALKQDEQWLTIMVSDEGVGIPQSEHERVFELFFQASNRPKTKVKGSGMGLTITREVVLKYGGQVYLQDNPSSQGCCFVVTLPRFFSHESESHE